MNSQSAHRTAALAATLVLSLLASVPGVAVEIALD